MFADDLSAGCSIPGMGLECVPHVDNKDKNAAADTSFMPSAIPGLDFSLSDSPMDDGGGHRRVRSVFLATPQSDVHVRYIQALHLLCFSVLSRSQVRTSFSDRGVAITMETVRVLTQAVGSCRQIELRVVVMLNFHALQVLVRP